MPLGCLKVMHVPGNTSLYAESNMNIMKVKYLIKAIGRRIGSYQLKYSLSKIQQKQNLFFMVVMKGGLHLAKLSIERFPYKNNIILICNGATKEEVAWAEKEIEVYKVIRSKHAVKHHQALDSIFKIWKLNFGIIDYDCFVYDQSVIDKMMSIDSKTLASSVFYTDNNLYRIKIPETFLMFFNYEVAVKVMNKYNISAKIYPIANLSEKVRLKINELGFSYNIMPEQQKKYFDTIRLLILLSYAEGYHIKCIKNNYNSKYLAAYHIGSVAKPNVVSDLYSLKGSYFWRLALERSQYKTLKEIGYQNFGSITSQHLLEKYSEIAKKIDSDFFDICDILLNKMDS